MPGGHGKNGHPFFWLVEFKQGSLHYTPEHCLVNGGVPLFISVEKANVSNGCKMYLLRSHVKGEPLTQQKEKRAEPLGSRANRSI